MSWVSATPPAVVSTQPRSLQPQVLRQLWRTRSGKAGLILVGVVLLAAILSWIGLTPHPPQEEDLHATLKGISLNHLMGTDQFGRDVLAQVMQAMGVSLEIAGLATLIATVVGSLGGIAAGYLGGFTSTVIMRASDIMFAIPAILLALAIVAALGPGVVDSSLAIGVGYIPIVVRVVRAPVLSLNRTDFVSATRVLGYSRTRVLLRHILPNVYGTVAVQASLSLAWAILAEAGLSFLGLGPPPPTASLGQMVYSSTNFASFAWWTLAGPSLAIVIAVLGFNFIGDGLRDATDPRSRRS
ncbi:MAG TPA: ABC transporter permease [Solirubrobacteraceae bacterium]|jgi:peptide/nickel transport system permease protein|nr:ABC transporter permease [Solirubrobacteraceae bacterium]